MFLSPHELTASNFVQLASEECASAGKLRLRSWLYRFFDHVDLDFDGALARCEKAICRTVGISLDDYEVGLESGEKDADSLASGLTSERLLAIWRDDVLQMN